MDLWGNEPEKPKIKKLSEVMKGTPTEQDKKAAESELQEVYREGVTERSSQEQWQIWARKTDDEIKSLKIAKSEMKDLREYIGKNERRLSELRSDVLKTFEGMREHFASMEDRIKSIESFLDQVKQAMGEEQDDTN